MNLPPYPKRPEPAWKGLTLQEMQMRRALVQARMEIQKFKMQAQYQGIRDRTPLLGGGKGTSVLSRITGAFSMAEYAIFAFRLVRFITPFFSKKKK